LTTAAEPGPAIALDGVTKLYGRHRGVLELDLEVRRGECFGFLGPNGAGKSTTIRLLLDLIRPTSGRIAVLGLDSRRESVEIRRRLGYLPGELRLYERLTPLELFEYFGHLRGGSDRRAAVELADRFDLELDRPIRSLSRGNKQKVGLVQAFAPRPELLVLDEPTSGLDPLVQQTFHALVRETVADGRTVFLSSHVLSEVQHSADRVGIVREGRLVAVEEVDSLLGRALRELEVRFAEPVPREALARIPGVQDVEVEGPVLRILVEGSVDAVVKALARHSVLDLSSREPDLEDLFLSYYQGDGDAS
jgi:beta-exotoxin I transport system ATP-binding protein